MSYQRHSISKDARKAHHKREKARRRKLRAKGGQVEPFGYVDIRGVDKAGMRRLSVSKGQRDGAPLLLASVGRNPEGEDRADGLRRNDEHAVAATGGETPEPGSRGPDNG